MKLTMLRYILYSKPCNGAVLSIDFVIIVLYCNVLNKNKASRPIDRSAVVGRVVPQFADFLN